MTQTTLFDLNQTASAAAVNALGKDAFQVANLKLEAFNGAGHDPMDYPDWDGMFVDRLSTFATLKNRPAKSTQAAIAAAQAQAAAQTKTT